MHIKAVFGSHYDAVYVDGEQLDPAESQAVFNHSPDGFSWGYGGSGPAQLALALLLHVGVDDEEAVRMHQAFKRDVVACWPQTDHETDLDIGEWIRRWRVEREVPA